MIQSANAKAQEKEWNKLIQELRTYLKETTENDAKTLSGLVYEKGIKNTLEMVDQVIYKIGSYPSYGNSGGIISVTYQYKPNSNPDCPYFSSEISFNTNSNQCRVITAIPDFNIREMTIVDYVEKMPEVTLSQTVSDYLGIQVSEKKTKEGGFNVSKVIPGSLAEFSGYKEGDILVKIDTYDLKDFEIDRVISYIAMRIQQKATVKGTVLRGGLQKVIDSKL